MTEAKINLELTGKWTNRLFYSDRAATRLNKHFKDLRICFFFFLKKVHELIHYDV